MSLRDQLHAQALRRDTVERAKRYAKRVIEDLPAETSAEAYKELADAYAAIASEVMRGGRS